MSASARAAHAISSNSEARATRAEARGSPWRMAVEASRQTLAAIPSHRLDPVSYTHLRAHETSAHL
eukprot:13906967-Alexandrium_andersonii.AAC.1